MSVYDSEMKRQSGTSRSYAERIAKGQPNATFSLPEDVFAALKRYADSRGVSRSSVVAAAITEYLRQHK